MDSNSGNRRSKQSSHFEENGNNDQPLSHLKYSVSSPSSSSSSLSSLSSVPSLDSLDGHIVLAPHPRSKDVCSDPEPRGHVSSRDSSNGPHSLAGGSQRGSSTRQVQQNQMMGVPGYDPNRIPLSVFSTKPTNPLDWSVASNESLFSIHVGNSSFSRDHVSSFYKSGELPSSDDQPIANLIPPTVNGLPTVRESNQRKCKNTDGSAETEALSEKSDETSESEDTSYEDEPEVIDVTTAKKMGNPFETHVENGVSNNVIKTPNDPGEVRHSSSMSCRSDTSNNSSRSFAFPVLAGEGTSNCSAKEKSDAKTTAKKQPESRYLEQPQPQPQLPAPQTLSSLQQPQLQLPKVSGKSWFFCFHCCLLRS